MAGLLGNKRYDRSRLLKRAAAARKKRKHKKAISLYRQVLAAEPRSTDLHQKIAPLLARTGQKADALSSYRIAAEALLAGGFKERAIGLLRAAAGELPREVELWLGVAELEASRGRKADAMQALLQGRRNFRSSRWRPQEIQLLTLARKLDPTQFRVSYDLACLLGRSGDRSQAVRLLEFVGRQHPRHRLRVRARQLWLDPSLGGVSRLARALVLPG